MGTERRISPRAAAHLFASQLALLGALGLAAVFAPAPLILRTLWLAGTVAGLLAVAIGLVIYMRSRSKVWLLLAAVSLAALVAAFPWQPWVLGW